MRNEGMFGRGISFPAAGLSHSAQMRGKGRKAIFRPENPNVALAAENRWRDGDRLHSGYQYAEPHSRHWPESSIKARRPMPAANAVCAQCALARDLSGKMSRAAGIRFTPFYWPASIGLRTFRGPSANAGWAVRRIERLARVLQLSFWPCPARLRRYLGGRRRRAGRSARVAPW